MPPSARILAALALVASFGACAAASTPAPDAGASLCPAGCDDGDPCTADACDPAAGCTHQTLADGSACGAGLCCGGKCFSAASDPDNCGGCGTTCDAPEKCWASHCSTCNQSFAAQTDYPIANGVETVAIADLNADGRADLVALLNGEYMSGDGHIDVYLSKGDGSLAPATRYATGLHPMSISIADFDGDGRPDLAVATWDRYSEAPRPGQLVTLMNHGDGTFESATQYETGELMLGGLVSADFDGDGRPDLAAVATPTPDVGAPLAGEVWVYRNEGGSFPSKTKFVVGGNPGWLSAADFDGDGRPDLAVANNGARMLTMLVNQGKAAFDIRPSQTVLEPTTLHGSPYGVVGDLNGDELPDIVTGGAVLVNQGGTFASAAASQLDEIASLALGDLDGDGRIDLLASHRALGSGLAEVSALPGLGNGSFGAGSSLGVSGYSLVLALGDLNGDGMPDLALAGSNGVSVLLSRCE